MISFLSINRSLVTQKYPVYFIRFLLDMSFKLNMYEILNISLAPVVQTVVNAIHRINHYPLDIAIGFAISYPVDSDLSGG